jgi:hypothetical protein
MASFHAQLSPKEQAAFRRIGLGASNAEEFRAEDIRRLIALGLVEWVDGDLTLSEPGRDRYRDLPRQSTSNPRRRRLKSRSLPF